MGSRTDLEADCRLTRVLGRSITLFGTAVVAFSAILPSAAAGQVPTGTAVRTESAPVVDGALDEAAWRNAPVLSGFVQREPNEGRVATEPTEIRVLFDESAVYIGAWMFDSNPDLIVHGETRRDAELKDVDAIVMVLDTYQDRQNGFVFGTTPAGIEYDGQVASEGSGGSNPRRRQQAGSGGGFNRNWDGNWSVATSSDGEGWYAEFRIPFTTLRYSGSGEQEWGLNVSRTVRRKNEESFWAPIGREFNLYRVSDAGNLTGVVTPTSRTLTVTPFVLGSTQRVYATQDEFENTAEIGGDAKIGLTPSLTLDLTVNTDFAQVEVDEEQVNLTRFRLFFPEKRPFFLENAGTFAVGTPQSVDLFFSRRIGIDSGNQVPILGGARLTGKVGGLTVGVLNIQADEVRETELVEGVEQEQIAAPSNNFSAVRVLKELPNRTRFGGIMVSRLNTDDGDDYNLTFGLDGRVGIGEALNVDGYVAKTETPGLDGNDWAASLGSQYTTRDWSLGFSYRKVSEDFNPEVGFVDRLGYRFLSARVLRKYRFESISSWFRELRPHVSLRQFWDLDGFTETRVLHIDSHFEFANGAFFQLPAINFTEDGLKEPFEIKDGVVIAPGSYSNVDWGFAYNTNKGAPISLEGRIDIGGFYSGTRYGASTTLNARAGDKLAASLRYSLNDVNLPEGDFQTNLVSLKAAYSFTPRIYVQSLVQYSDLTENWSANVRFGWLNAAGTGLFIVFNDMEHRGLFERTGIPRGPVQRSFIIKFTRLLDVGR